MEQQLIELIRITAEMSDTLNVHMVVNAIMLLCIIALVGKILNK